MFSPLAFPTGMIVYDISTSLPPSTQTGLFPFELFRQPLIIIGIADDRESRSGPAEVHRAFSEEDRQNEPTSSDMSQLLQDVDELRESYPSVLVHQVLLFDYVRGGAHSQVPEGIIVVPPPKQSRTTTIKTVMCDLTSYLLAEFTTFAKSLQGLPSIDSPSASQPAQPPQLSSHTIW